MTSCSTTFIIQNVQVYFDYCSTCIIARNLALHHSLANITAFQLPLNLSIDGHSGSQISTKICSTPIVSQLSENLNYS